MLADPLKVKALEDLCKLQCTQVEIAAFMGVSVKTIEAWAKVAWIREIMSAGQHTGIISLRRAQFNTALAGNATMQIWLGKQLLGQKDTVVSEHTGGITVTDATYREQLASKLARLAEQGPGHDPPGSIKPN